MNLFDLLQSAAESDPERPAVLFGDCSITFRQLMSAAQGVSRYLRSLGVKVGDRVLMYSPNCPEYLPIYLGSAHMGAIFAP
jgi:acyl-CoA synthetase (AMP-forming)/AMP-acid ligase II